LVRAFVSYVHRIDSNSILLLLKSSDVAIGVEEMHHEVQIDAVPIRSTSTASGVVCCSDMVTTLICLLLVLEMDL